MTDFERFRELAVGDAALRDQLLAETETVAFVEAAMAAARERGLAVTEEELRSELESATRSWIARQVR
jgi:hypothetical protein